MATLPIDAEIPRANPETAEEPGDAAQIVQQVRRAFHDGEHERGCSLAHTAIEAGIRHPSLYYLRGISKARQQDYERALADFRSARALAPADPVLLEAIGHCLTMQGQFREAVEAFDSAIVIKPDFARAHFRKGVALGLLNEIDGMRTAHRQVLELEPRNADALASLAFIAARKDETGEARDKGWRAIELAPRNPIARIALAMADIHDGQYAKGEETLLGVLRSSAEMQDGKLNMALGFAADALDRHGRYQEAFRLYAEVNARRRQIHASRFADDRAIEDVTILIEAVKRYDFGVPDKHLTETFSPAARHAFLLGFVRSGTTLLETILASHPSVVASDERDFLAGAANELLHGKKDMRQLAALDSASLARWRADYWDSARAAGFSPAGKVFVDKVPLNSLRLPLIARLFPDARILFAIRDPRDVVLSTFRHRFNMYPASFEFLRLEDCARFYSSAMQLVETMRERAPFLRLCEIRYEDLISDFDQTVRGACKFLDMDWNEAMREFQSASPVIDRRSQSAAQVKRGLYQGAAGQWRHYASQLAPALPILEPWIRHFGYNLD